MSWWSELFPCCEQGERPGGLALTRYAIAQCGFPAKARLADLGCGSGATLQALQAFLDAEIIGVDSDPMRQSAQVLCATAQALPFADSTLDGILMECSFSQMEPAHAVLAECARVLKPSGKLILTDLYSKSDISCSRSPLGRLDTQDTLTEALHQHRLSPILFEDHSRELAQLWAGALLSGKGDVLRQTIAQSPALRGVSCGYYLCIAERSD